jgi:hypothetical protein
MEPNGGKFALPGTYTDIDVWRGPVVVFDLPDGQLVYPTQDGERLKRFVEERVKLARSDRKSDGTEEISGRG